MEKITNMLNELARNGDFQFFCELIPCMMWLLLIIVMMAFIVVLIYDGVVKFWKWWKEDN